MNDVEAVGGEADGDGVIELGAGDQDDVLADASEGSFAEGRDGAGGAT
jgi:hypothetical protein